MIPIWELELLVLPASAARGVTIVRRVDLTDRDAECDDRRFGSGCGVEHNLSLERCLPILAEWLERHLADIHDIIAIALQRHIEILITVRTEADWPGQIADFASEVPIFQNRHLPMHQSWIGFTVLHMSCPTTTLGGLIFRAASFARAI